MKTIIKPVVMVTNYKPKFFTEMEFKRIGCSLSDIDVESLKRLEACRRLAQIPFILTSAYRTPEEDIAKGRSGNSAHTRGRAFDIRCTSDKDRHTIVSSAIKVGFTRIGISKTFVHLDDDVHCLPSPRIWLY